MGPSFLICVSKVYSVIETSSLSPKRLRGKTKVSLRNVTCQSPYLFLPILASIASPFSKIYFEIASSQSSFSIVTIYHLLSSYHELAPCQILCIMASFNSLNDPKISDLYPFSDETEAQNFNKFIQGHR